MGFARPESIEVERLRDEFRRHLETFYATLKLAPPYHSVEQALSQLTIQLNALPPAERAGLAADATRKWAQFREAFVASGLHHKHRGILAGIARTGPPADFPQEYRLLLDACQG